MSIPSDKSLRMEARGLYLLIHVIGELDHHYCEFARGRIDDYYDQCRALHMVFDFSGIAGREYDSSLHINSLPHLCSYIVIIAY